MQNNIKLYFRGTPRPEVFPISESNSTPIKQLNQPRFSSYRYHDKSGISPTIRTMQGGNLQPKILDGAKIRRLTPTECERLQGFPDGWTATDADGKPVSDTQRYKMMGNAVTTNVVTEVVKRIFYDQR